MIEINEMNNYNHNSLKQKTLQSIINIRVNQFNNQIKKNQ